VIVAYQINVIFAVALMTTYCPILRRLMPPQLPMLFANIVAIAPGLLLLLSKFVLSLACLNSQ